MYFKVHGPLRDFTDQSAMLEVEANCYEDLRQRLSKSHGKLASLLPTPSGARGYIRLFLDGTAVTPEELEIAHFTDRTVLDARMSVSGG